ncbi:MAG TPA: GAF domain-containing protein [Steroidobacteraceae bacterium]
MRNASDSSDLDFLAGGGEMGERMRALDWTRTPLGSPVRWPQSLKTIVRVMLDSRYAMWMLWGPELTFLCNDAYAPTLGIKRDWALGARSDKVWAEIWADVKPRIDQVLEQGRATWDEALLLFLERSGFPEETYHTFSYSPVYDDESRIAGMLCVITEVTERVVGERRLRILQELAARAAGATSVEESCRGACKVLEQHPVSMPFAAIYLLDRDSKSSYGVARTGNLPEQALPPTLDLSNTRWPLEALVSTETAQHVADLPGKGIEVRAGPWPEVVQQAFLLPLKGAGSERLAGFIIAGASPRRALDDAYRNFFGLVAGQIAAAIADAQTVEAERRRAEALAELTQMSRESEERLRLATDAAEIGLWDVDVINDKLYWLSRVKAMFGISPDVPVSMADFYAGLHPADREHTSDAFAGALDPVQRALYDVEYRTVGKEDGLIRWVAAKGRGIFDGSGRCVRVIGTAIDITARKRAEERLHEETRVQELLGRTSHALVAAQLDTERVVQIVTDAATELSGAAFGAFFYNIQGDKGEFLRLYTLSGAPREAFSRFPQPRNTGVFGPTFHGEPVVRSADITADPRYGHNAPHRGMPPGHLPVRSYLAVPVKMASGEVLGGLFFGHPDPGVFGERAERLVLAIAAQAAVAFDNARLHRASQLEIEQRKRIQEELDEANRRKDEFLAMLAHELRNPLSPIGTASELLSHTVGNDARAHTAIDMIKRQVAQLTRLVDDLLDVSRITQGRIQLRQRPVDLTSVIAEAVETAEPQLRERRHKLSMTASSYEPLFVMGDFARLVQCVGNILTNAIKYTEPAGEIAIRTGADQGSVFIEISDTGVGISADLLPRVFDLFVQSERTLDRSQGGLGIGLAVVKRLVDMHRGEVGARSEGHGRGATFQIRLPRIARPTAASADGAPFEAEPRRVLIVDDNADAANSLSMLLSIQGHETQVAYGAQEALACVEDLKPEIALLDIGLPEMDGYELARRLRAMSPRHTMCLIALTGYGQVEDAQRAIAAGFDHHLVKPVNLKALDRALAGLSAGPACRPLADLHGPQYDS